MQKFIIYWRDGKSELVEGASITDAFRSAGYSAGALRAMDFFKRGEHHSHTWCATEKKWKLIGS